MRERRAISVVKEEASESLDRILIRVKALKSGFKHLDRESFKMIERSLDLLDKCITKALDKKRASGELISIPTDEIDELISSIIKENKEYNPGPDNPIWKNQPPHYYSS